MGSLTISNKTLDKYFGFLTRLDTNSKKRLIIKLTESLDLKKESSFDLSKIFGAWEDIKDSDDIIRQIKDSRMDKPGFEAF